VASGPGISSRRSGDECWLDIDLGDVAEGTYYVWIAYPDGRVCLVALVK
jgi:hypothetical protein